MPIIVDCQLHWREDPGHGGDGKAFLAPEKYRERDEWVAEVAKSYNEKHGKRYPGLGSNELRYGMILTSTNSLPPMEDVEALEDSMHHFLVWGGVEIEVGNDERTEQIGDLLLMGSVADVTDAYTDLNPKTLPTLDQCLDAAHVNRVLIGVPHPFARPRGSGLFFPRYYMDGGKVVHQGKDQRDLLEKEEERGVPVYTLRDPWTHTFQHHLPWKLINNSVVSLGDRIKPNYLHRFPKDPLEIDFREAAGTDDGTPQLAASGAIVADTRLLGLRPSTEALRRVLDQGRPKIQPIPARYMLAKIRSGLG